MSVSTGSPGVTPALSGGDRLYRFVFEHFGVRGLLVDLEDTWRAAIARHDYTPGVRAVLGEAMSASVLLAGSLKLDGRMSLQLQAEGPLKFLVVQCARDLSLRGMAKVGAGAGTSGGFAELVAGGRLAITLEPAGRERYQGVVPLDQQTLAACLDRYFRTSEQLPTRLWLFSGAHRAAGLLLQKLPPGPGEDWAADEDWARVQRVPDALAPDDLFRDTGQALLQRLFRDDDVRLYQPQLVRFHCRCSRERIEDVLRMLGQQEMREALDECGRVDVSCEFCNASYSFDPVDVQALFSANAGTPSPRLH